MWHEADLTQDEDLRSVYGQAAVDARLWALLDALLAKHDARSARLDALVAASRRPLLPPPPPATS